MCVISWLVLIIGNENGIDGMETRTLENKLKKMCAFPLWISNLSSVNR